MCALPGRDAELGLERKADLKLYFLGGKDGRCGSKRWTMILPRRLKGLATLTTTSTSKRERLDSDGQNAYDCKR